MNTAHGRLLLIHRDTSSAAHAIAQLHRCIVKIKQRAASLETTSGMIAAGHLHSAETRIGDALGFLDRVTADIDAERRRVIQKRREERGEAQRLAITRRIN